MAHLLGAENLHLEFPTTVVFDRVSLGVDDGDRIGIVGRNGDGKSSLLGMLTGQLEPDAGRVIVPANVRIGSLAQSDDLDDSLSVKESVVGSGAEYEWASDPKIRDVLAGLLHDVDLETPTGSLSGGQRRRVSLAKLLIGEWDVIGLDEPTNHLDIEGITWLAGHLKTRWRANRGGLLVVTHDRWFLDEVCTTTWEVHDRIVEPFDGGYAAYVLQRVERDRQAAVVESRRQNLARKELAWLRRGAPARTAKPKFRIDAANELISDVPEIRNQVQLEALALNRLGKIVVDLLDVSIKRGANPVLENVTWRLAPGERAGILGANGAGKSTLLQLLAGKLEPDAGRVRTGKTVELATLTQHFEHLEPHLDEPVHAVLARLRTNYSLGEGSKSQELAPSQLLERLGFSSAHLSTPVRDLSGGQKRRLQLLLILLEQPNVLLLDEPTNDLDTDMLTVLEDLLDSWAGTLVVVSHDRYFLERTTDNQYALMDQQLRHLPGGIDEYLQLQKASDQKQASDSASRASRQPETEQSALSGAQIHATRKEVAAIERKIEKLSDTRSGVEQQLNAHDPSDYEGLAKLTEQLQQLGDEVSELEERWLELSEMLN